jgi:hypothetical protein
LLVTEVSHARFDVQIGPNEGSLAALVENALAALRQLLPNGLLVVYVERQLDEPAIARTSPSLSPTATADEFSLELRLASWLTVLDEPGIRTVPKYMQDWLPLAKTLVVPLRVSGQHRGAFIIELLALGRREVESIEMLANVISGRLAEFERESPHGVVSVRDRFADSVRRIKVATRP